MFSSGVYIGNNTDLNDMCRSIEVTVTIIVYRIYSYRFLCPVLLQLTIITKTFTFFILQDTALTL